MVKQNLFHILLELFSRGEINTIKITIYMDASENLGVDPIIIAKIEIINSNPTTTLMTKLV